MQRGEAARYLSPVQSTGSVTHTQTGREALEGFQHLIRLTGCVLQLFSCRYLRMCASVQYQFNL